MKKIYKKQKVTIIVFSIIAIILVIVFTGCVINNNKINKEKYFDNTGNASSNLVARYIKKGITIGGITGTLEILDTSDATATAEEITWRKTAYVKGKKITGTYVPLNNYTFTDSLGNKVKVPGGFGIVNPEDNVTDGIIIEDVKAGDENSKGSQFVWIPVGDVITDSSGSKKTITLGRYNFDEITGKEKLEQTSENWREEIALGLAELYEYSTKIGDSEVAKNLQDFIKKATYSGGYYIGRYEAGDAYATSTEHPDSGTRNPVTCKEGVYPYSEVSQPEASQLSRNMYNNGNFESDLVNSYAWDTAILFIQEFSDDKDYSIQSSLQNSLAKCGEATDGKNKDVKCNIYDMAGNVWEFSTENNSVGHTGIRGGVFSGNKSDNPNLRASMLASGDYGGSNIGFRPILYL